MNIFLHEMRSYRNSTLIWASSLTALSVLYVFLYNAILPDIESFQIVINSMPEVVRKILNIFVESIASLEGFYSFAFMYIMLCGSIQAMNLGVSIVSKEGRAKTVDFLLTKPVRRKAILTSKLAAVVACLLITNVVFIGCTLLSTLTVTTPFDLETFLMIAVTMLFVQLIFLSIGLLVSVSANKVKSVTSISLSTVFGFFIVSMLGSVIGDEAVRYISPFEYFDMPYIMQNHAYETPFLILGGAVVIVSVAASYVIFIKKDIHTV